MSLTPAVEQLKYELKNYLEQFDWSKLTSGQKKVLDTFLQVAVTNGFTSVTMRSLAKALNMKAPSLYAHFPEGRDEIISQTLRWHYHRYGISLLQALEQAQSLEECWTNTIQAHIENQIYQPGSELWDLMIATDKVGGFLQEDLRLEIEKWIEFCERVYFAITDGLYLNPTTEKIKIILTLLDGAKQWAHGQNEKESVLAITQRSKVICEAILRT